MASSEDETEINKNAITWQEFLIEAVRARPALYSKNSRDYFDSTVTKNLWRDVTGMLLGAGFSVLNGDPIVNIGKVIECIQSTFYYGLYILLIVLIIIINKYRPYTAKHNCSWWGAVVFGAQAQNQIPG